MATLGHIFSKAFGKTRKPGLKGLKHILKRFASTLLEENKHFLISILYMSKPEANK